MTTIHVKRAAVAVLLLTTACSTGTPSEDPAPPPATPPADRIRTDGLVVFHVNDGQPVLTFHDVGDGGQHTQVDLSGLVGGDLNMDAMQASHFAFTPDFRRAAYEGASGVHVGVLDDAEWAYTPTALLEAENTFNGGTPTLERPQFSPDGAELWMVAAGQRDSETETVLGVDVTNTAVGDLQEKGEVPAGAVPRWQTQPGRQPALTHITDVWDITDNGDLAVASGVHTTSDGLDYLELGGDIVPLNFVGDGEGRWFAPPGGISGMTEQTTVEAFDLEVGGEPTNVRTVASGGAVEGFWPDPAGDRLIIQANDASFYEAPLTGPGAAAPSLLFEELLFEGPAAAGELGVMDGVIALAQPR
ncbi:hypothetical protein [Marinitenerispora sediminis]|uniref:WD40 repeat protein n=1 Tax=Marinitenerispora sediminis TaxID=1931232 RepID=A0A368T5J2_9ACTN|nr:hypothetical protein [Marinitenerispora sediminis]RCV51852.1 hypothetical protein DEF28_14370 [Marinitenerispora sediminis]RCV54825.1 hypothetical protein DEF23_15335 [Marinitenerispora sediminis]RCV58971.1 hypothetical protein DEF24_11655 [Marinitenerispora sediminis]